MRRCRSTGVLPGHRLWRHAKARPQQYADRCSTATSPSASTPTTPAFPGSSQPVSPPITIKIGETAQAHFSATNNFDRAITGRATFNVQPELAGPYFNKVECFCFTDTTLKPGETLDMPVCSMSIPTSSTCRN